MKDRVLFVPDMMPSHIIPLMALARQLKEDLFDYAFLLPELYHDYAKSLGFTVLAIDHKRADRSIPQMMAIEKFKPDIIVDDLSYATAFLTKLLKLPRIAIVRKGVLPFESNITGYEHSCQHIGRVMDEIKEWAFDEVGMWKPQHFSDLFIGDLNIIPAVPSVELLPELIENKDAYIYSGPLVLHDEEIMASEKYLSLQGKNPGKSIDDFLHAHRHRKTVYFTTGLTIIPEIHSRLTVCIRSLLNNGIAVITNEMNPPGLSKEERSMLYTARLLPMHKVCSNVNFMIHHCGSGTYNYQLMHKVPAIILGSRLYDRDEIAVRLDELGAACYLSADLEDDTFFSRFGQAVSALLNTSSATFQKQSAILKQLNKEITDTRRKFNFTGIVSRLLHRQDLISNPFYRK
jgi:hypothetical protein